MGNYSLHSANGMEFMLNGDSTTTCGISIQHDEERGTTVPPNEGANDERQGGAHSEDQQIRSNVRGKKTVGLVFRKQTNVHAFIWVFRF